MKVVVDTNILFSAILNSQSWIGQVLLKSDKSVKFFSPKYLQTEIFNHIEKIEKITKLPKNEIIELIEILYTRIHFLSEEFIPKEILFMAEELTADVDYDDAVFVALSIHLRAKLWTGDKKLMAALLQKGFNRFITLDKLRHKIIKK
jgi:putative PIN family toxin of toxin-antitoxin system